MLVLLVGNVLPVGIPPELGVDAGNDQRRNGDTEVLISILCSLPFRTTCCDWHCVPSQCRCLGSQRAAHPWRNSLERQLPPELARLVGVLRNASALTVKLVVFGARELLGALGAVVA